MHRSHQSHLRPCGPGILVAVRYRIFTGVRLAASRSSSRRSSLAMSVRHRTEPPVRRPTGDGAEEPFRPGRAAMNTVVDRALRPGRPPLP